MLFQRGFTQNLQAAGQAYHNGVAENRFRVGDNNYYLIMKQLLILLKRIRTIAPVIIVLFLCMAMTKCSCGKQEDETAPPCNMPSAFIKMYEANVSDHPTYADGISMDLQTHEYKFRPHTNRSICKVGYQGNAALYTANIPYTIEIADAAGTILYTGSHRFASGTIDYHTLSNPVNVTAGLVYTVRRIIADPSVSLDKLQGRVLNYNYPSGTMPTVTYGIIDIVGSNFYGRGGPIPNYGIPFIDIVF